MAHISDIKLIRIDTTLEYLSQKAEKANSAQVWLLLNFQKIQFAELNITMN
ncbi:hypothetical protein YC2023_010122 [Brassica napus]